MEVISNKQEKEEENSSKINSKYIEVYSNKTTQKYIATGLQKRNTVTKVH